MPTSEPRLNVVALDPGEKVGIAYATCTPKGLGNLHRNILPYQEAAEWLYAQQVPLPTGTNKTFDVIVYETWVPRPVKGSMAWIQGDPLLSAQFVGMLRFIARLSGARLKSYGPDRKNAWEAWMKTIAPDEEHSSARHDDDHDWDATLHLVGYYAENWFKGKQP